MSFEAVADAWFVKTTPTKKLILLALADYKNPDHEYAFPSIKAIAEKTGLSERCIQENLRTLEEEGLFTCVARVGRSNAYYLSIPPRPVKVPRPKPTKEEMVEEVMQLTRVEHLAQEGPQPVQGGTQLAHPEPLTLKLLEETNTRPHVVDDLFLQWKTIFNHPRSQLDPTRRKLIHRALKMYTFEQLVESMKGYHESPFHMGGNEDGKVYDDVTLIFRNAEKIEAGWKYLSGPAARPANGANGKYDPTKDPKSPFYGAI